MCIIDLQVKFVTGGFSMKKYFALFMAVCLLAVCPCAWADYWNEGHSGTEADPYVIDTNADLEALGKRVNAGTEEVGKYYKLATNLGNHSVTIGTDKNPFQGHFDGQSHEIEVKVEARGNFSGLFGTVSTKDGYAVKNLNLKFTGKIDGDGSTDGHYVGGIVLSLKSGIIEGCSFSGTLHSYYSYEKDSALGGIVSVMSGGTVKNCSFTGSLSADTVPGGRNRDITAGGIAGVIKQGAGSIEGCTSKGSIYASFFGNAGGIVGKTISAATIKDCTFSGNVEGRSHAGGIAGFLGRSSLSNNKLLSTSANPSMIRGWLYAGGIAGSLAGTSAESAVIEKCAVQSSAVVSSDLSAGASGGIIGLMNISTVRDNESHASVIGSVTGGIIGKLRAATYSVSQAYASASYAIISNNIYSSAEYGIGSNSQGVPSDEGCIKANTGNNTNNNTGGNNTGNNTNNDNQTNTNTNGNNTSNEAPGSSGGGCNSLPALALILTALFTLRKSRQ